MRFKTKIITTILIIVGMVAFYMLVIPAFLNTFISKNKIEKTVYEKMEIKTDLGNIRFSMGSFPSVWVKSNYVEVINNDNSKALFIENPKIKIRLLPLILRKIELAHIYAKNENINIKLDKNKVFYLGDYPLKINKHDDKFTLEKINFDLGNYIINIDDKLNDKLVSINGDYLKDSFYKKNDKFKLSTKGVFKSDNSATPYYSDIELDLPLNKFNNDNLKINAKINDFNLSTISDYVDVLTNGIIKNIRGILNFEIVTNENKKKHKIITAKVETKDLEILGKDKPSSIIYHFPLLFKSNLEVISGGVKFKDTILEGKGLHFKLDGKLTKSGKRIPAMNLKLEIKPSKLEEACAILPWFREIPNEMDFYKFKEYGVYGKGEGNLHFIGKGSRPNVYGNVKLSEGYILRKGLVTPEGASVNMDFVGMIMNIDVFVPTFNNQSVSVNGMVKIDGSKYSELNIKSTDSVDMENAQIVLNPLHEMLKFKIGPVPLMKIKGLANIDVRSAGKKIDPHLFGKMTFRNATASFIDIHNLTINNASGEILFQDRNIPFKTKTGTINGKPTSISGECNVFGDLNVNAETKGQNIPDMIKVINSSKDMVDVQKVVKPFTKPQGIGDLYLNIYGNAKDVTRVKFNEDIFAKGKVVFHDASTVLKDTYLPFNNINGEVNFDKKDADYDVSGVVRNSKLHVKGTAHDKDMDLVATSEDFKIIDILDMLHPEMRLPLKKEIGNLNVSFIGKYKGKADSDNLEYDKIIADGKIIPNTNSSNLIKVYSGNFNIKNSVLYGNSIKGNIEGNPYSLSFAGTDIYKKMKLRDAVFNFNNFDISSLDEIKNMIELPQQYKQIVNNIDDIKGHVDINGYMKNGGVYTNTELKNLSLTYKPLDLVFNILSGRMNMQGDTLYLSKVNSKLGSMPIYVNGRISNIFNSPNLNLYSSGKLNQEFFDKFINEKSVYPVKLKGDANFISKLNGEINNIHANSSLNIGENSSIYYMGATLSGAPSGVITSDGVSTNPVNISSDLNILPNSLKINSFTYNQIISSQNKKTSVQNQLNISGVVSLLKDNVLKFNNLRIKTNAPTDAKIFNILLKKPTIKQGLFTTDILVNGTSLAPKASGKLNIKSIDIPLFDATIKDVDVDFEKDYIYLNSRGIILTNDIIMLLKIVNNPQPPYIIENMEIKTDTLDLNVIANRFNDYDTDKLRSKQINADNNISLQPNTVIINDAKILADRVIIKKAQATDFSADMNITDDNILHINNYNFNLANGQISGNIESNLNTMESKATMSINNADAQIISDNFFDLTGQMYGQVTGELNAACKGLSGVECLNTLSGEGSFNVIDGRMPKLGSLEYLLKAANLVTGGITGVSINGIIDLITPLKTGNFDKISGNVKVQNGVATDINVYSYGKELNMYLTGSYDLSTLVADMEIYGCLSKNFSTLLGKIGNASLNRLFNSIPGININEINPQSTSNINKIPNFNRDNTLRVFKAEILGDINGSNYVKSFKWIKH